MEDCKTTILIKDVVINILYPALQHFSLNIYYLLYFLYWIEYWADFFFAGPQASSVALKMRSLSGVEEHSTTRDSNGINFDVLFSYLIFEVFFFASQKRRISTEPTFPYAPTTHPSLK